MSSYGCITFLLFRFGAARRIRMSLISDETISDKCIRFTEIRLERTSLTMSMKLKYSILGPSRKKSAELVTECKKSAEIQQYWIDWGQKRITIYRSAIQRTAFNMHRLKLFANHFFPIAGAVAPSAHLHKPTERSKRQSRRWMLELCKVSKRNHIVQ